jgi:deoxyribodipyrimidine photo-lyase
VPPLRLDDVPPIRIRVAGPAPVRPTGAYVLYWMTAARRAGSSFALDRAVGWARELGKPLVILEAIRVAYPWASDRIHRFVLDGMADNARRLGRAPRSTIRTWSRGAARGGACSTALPRARRSW